MVPAVSEIGRRNTNQCASNDVETMLGMILELGGGDADEGDNNSHGDNQSISNQICRGHHQRERKRGREATSVLKQLRREGGWKTKSRSW